MRNNEGRTQIPPELLEKFLKQQEEKIVGAPSPTQPVVQQSGYQVPTDFVDLPSGGKFYPPDHAWHNKDKVEVRFMTTREEDILSSQQYAEAGVMFDRLIESICVDRVSARSLLLGDRDAILINARKNSYGDMYEFESYCTECLASFEHSINLGEIKSKELNQEISNGKISVVLPVSKSTVEFKLATVGDIKHTEEQRKVREKHGLPFSLVSETHRSMIVSIDGNTDTNYIVSFINQMLLRDSRFLQKMYIESKPELDFTYVHECTKCGHENRGGVPVGMSFFWADS